MEYTWIALRRIADTLVAAGWGNDAWVLRDAARQLEEHNRQMSEPAPAPETSGPTLSDCPKCGQFRGHDHPCDLEPPPTPETAPREVVETSCSTCRYLDDVCDVVPPGRCSSWEPAPSAAPGTVPRVCEHCGGSGVVPWGDPYPCGSAPCPRCRAAPGTAAGKDER